MDSRVHCAEPEGAHWQLHQRLLGVRIIVVIACLGPSKEYLGWR